MKKQKLEDKFVDKIAKEFNGFPLWVIEELSFRLRNKLTNNAVYINEKK